VVTVNKKPDKIDRLFENFASEKVSVIIDKDITLTMESEEMSQTQQTPLQVNGYLTDVDDEFLYLGHEPNGIHQAIRKDYIVHMEIFAEEVEEVEGILQTVETTKMKRDYN
jgi:hypothetical protein